MEFCEIKHSPEKICYLETITENFKGVIIVTSKDKPIGYISYYDDRWSMYNKINTEYTEYYDDSFNSLMEEIERAFKDVKYLAVSF